LGEIRVCATKQILGDGRVCTESHNHQGGDWMKCRNRHETKMSAHFHERRGTVRRFGVAAVVTASAWALLATAAAQASTIAVGSVLPTTFSSTQFGQVETFFNTALPEKGANLVSPVTGAIVRWRVQGAKGGPFYLRVLRPTGSGAYTAIGTSSGATPSGTGLQTFTANLPIRAGDLIGVDPTSATDEIGVAEVPGASFGFTFPPPFDGSTVAPSGAEAGKEIELSAEVQPAPEITSIVPSSGSIAGGSTVTITGTDLAGASSVKFGTTPASSFVAESETQIMAVAPPGVAAGPVDVTATTLAGTSTPNHHDAFTYTACVVPKLKGKKLRSAKKALRRADCRIGKVKRRKRAAQVIKQNPKPRTVLAPGSKVNVSLGK
jgi:IPT/TIG domain-containing protein/PASTA domain-containing protein